MISKSDYVKARAQYPEFVLVFIAGELSIIPDQADQIKASFAGAPPCFWSDQHEHYMDLIGRLYRAAVFEQTDKPARPKVTFCGQTQKNVQDQASKTQQRQVTPPAPKHGSTRSKRKPT